MKSLINHFNDILEIKNNFSSIINRIEQCNQPYVIYTFWHADYCLYEILLSDQRSYLCPCITYIDGVLQIPPNDYII